MHADRQTDRQTDTHTHTHTHQTEACILHNTEAEQRQPLPYMAALPRTSAINTGSVLTETPKSESPSPAR